EDDAAAVTSCSVKWNGAYDRTYNFEVKNNGIKLWVSTAVDTVTGQQIHIGSCTLPPASGIYKPTKWTSSNGTPGMLASLRTVVSLSNRRTVFGNPTITKNGSIGTQSRSYEYGDCKGQIAFHTEEVTGGVGAEKTIRFLDTPLLPSSTPEDCPKVIKSGIDDEGQHPKSPNVTGPSGISTLLHRIGRKQLLERLLDVSGTEEFDLRVYTDNSFHYDLYVKRRGRDIEIGFIDSDGQWAQPGIRYFIEDPPSDSSYQVAKWIPVSTSEFGEAWRGPEHWIRAQGGALAKAIWYHHYYNYPDVEVSWSGMSPAEKDDLAAWLKERSEILKMKSDKEDKEYQDRKNEFGDKFHLEEERLGMEAYYKTRRACRAQCGEGNPKLVCSKCKIARYCSPECQKEDWKYHKTYCGTETPIPKEFD
ncbi:hypothetical protein CVT25_002718, partial [Psilocybe cyanescens]